LSLVSGGGVSTRELLVDSALENRNLIAGSICGSIARRGFSAAHGGKALPFR
jgi:hypothetical protein